MRLSGAPLQSEDGATYFIRSANGPVTLRADTVHAQVEIPEEVVFQFELTPGTTPVCPQRLCVHVCVCVCVCVCQTQTEK